MSEKIAKLIVEFALCLIFGVYIGYSMAYNDVITGCDNTHAVTNHLKIYSCVEQKP